MDIINEFVMGIMIFDDEDSDAYVEKKIVATVTAYDTDIDNVEIRVDDMDDPKKCHFFKFRVYDLMRVCGIKE